MKKESFFRMNVMGGWNNGGGEGNLIILIKTLYDHGIMHSFSVLCVEGACVVSCSQADATT